MANVVGLLLKEQFTQKCTRYHSLLMPMESLVTCLANAKQKYIRTAFPGEVKSPENPEIPT